MKKEILKRVVVIITVVSFFIVTSASAFAQSASGSNNFSILGNIPEEQAFQLSDGEMAKVEGEGPIAALGVTVAWLAGIWGQTYAMNLAIKIIDTAAKKGKSRLTWGDIMNALKTSLPTSGQLWTKTLLTLPGALIKINAALLAPTP